MIVELVFQIWGLANLLACFVGQQMLTDSSLPVLIKMALLFDLCLPLCMSEGFDYFEPQDVYRLLSSVVCRDLAPCAICAMAALGLSYV